MLSVSVVWSHRSQQQLLLQQLQPGAAQASPQQVRAHWSTGQAWQELQDLFPEPGTG